MIQNEVVTLSAASIQKKFFHTGDWYGQKELTPPSCLAGGLGEKLPQVLFFSYLNIDFLNTLSVMVYCKAKIIL